MNQEEYTNNTSPSQLIDKTLTIVISEFNSSDNQLIKEYLCSYTRGIFVSPNYLAKHGYPKNIDDLQNHNCLIHKLSTPTNEWIFADNK